jgi:uncharacterized membrane protein YcgQ (UPF0703/DUF1980 family)
VLPAVASRQTERGRFELARFYITCCVADSVPIGVRIALADPQPQSDQRDDWLDVSSELVRRGKPSCCARRASSGSKRPTTPTSP